MTCVNYYSDVIIKKLATYDSHNVEITLWNGFVQCRRNVFVIDRLRKVMIYDSNKI